MPTLFEVLSGQAQAQPGMLRPGFSPPPPSPDMAMILQLLKGAGAPAADPQKAIDFFTGGPTSTAAARAAQTGWGKPTPVQTQAVGPDALASLLAMPQQTVPGGPQAPVPGMPFIPGVAEPAVAPAAPPAAPSSLGMLARLLQAPQAQAVPGDTMAGMPGADIAPVVEAPASVTPPAPGGGAFEQIMQALRAPGQAKSPLVRDVAGFLGLPGAQAPGSTGPIASMLGAQSAAGMMPSWEDIKGYVMGAPAAPAAQSTTPPGAQAPAAPKPFTWGGIGAGGASAGPTSFTIGGPPSGGGNVAGYLTKMVGAESGGKMVPNAAGASSAFGPAQFTDGTWIDTVKKHAPDVFSSVKGNRQELLQMRTDPKFHMQMAEAFTNENAKILSDAKLPINDQNLYAMHFFGQGAGPKVLAAAPDTPISDLVGAEAIRANPHLKGMTAGQAVAWAGNTINKQGGGTGTGNAFGLPSAPNITRPQIPAPPAVIAAKTTDPNAYDAYSAIKAVAPEPMGTADKVTNILAAMAQGARGTKNIGDFFLGMGGGAGTAASQNIQGARKEAFQFARDEMENRRFQAEVGVRKAGAVADRENAGIAATNINNENQWKTIVKNSELDADVQNKLADYNFKLAEKAWSLGQPDFKTLDDGRIVMTTRQPQGGIKFDVVNMGTQDGLLKQAAAQADQLKKLGITGGPVDSMRYMILGNQAAQRGGAGLAKEALTVEVLRETIEKDGLKDIFGEENYKQIVKRAEEGIPTSAKADTNNYPEMLKQRLLLILSGDREKQGRDNFDKILLKGAQTKFGHTGPGFGANLILNGGI